MALKTIGTTAQTSLSAFVVGPNDVIAADVATLITQIKSDPVSAEGGPIGTFQASINQAYVRKGTLFIPNRGKLLLRTGDYICWNTVTGWPIVLSAFEAANGSWVHT
jgi:hypothetical protein